MTRHLGRNSFRRSRSLTFGAYKREIHVARQFAIRSIRKNMFPLYRIDGGSVSLRSIFLARYLLTQTHAQKDVLSICRFHIISSVLSRYPHHDQSLLPETPDRIVKTK